ncbi:MAG: ElyC/SanA/YdcF family protein [Candidatus Gracilibacteria bacterium]|nr:ElyC/SanA/YdcF family protein [Candidatus Gracilibacteria bacterium]
MKKITKYLLIIIIFLLIIILSINLYVISFSKDKIYSDINSIQKTKVGLVFGAKVLKNGIPSDILKDRLLVAIDAYKDKKIEKIIVSGDNSRDEYDEPTSMRDYLISNGVLKDDIYLDYAGFDTLDSLYRAREIFGVDELILFTQEFHLKRALYISSRMGIKSIGVQTNLQKYTYDNYYDRREVFARIKAFLNVEILKSKSKYGGKKVDMSKPQEEISLK